jgi:23S rRNA (uracil1939-C5)-methyltransferase
VKIEVETEIGEIGARGDGIATLEDGRKLYVPYTVPGDRIRARVGAPRPDGFSGRIAALLAPGPGRGAPSCGHFGICGGCALQHLDAAHYRSWKSDLVVKALARQEIAAGAIRPLWVTPPRSRRRADFTAVRRKADLLLGFNARGTHQVIDLAECPVSRPEIVALLPPLRELLMNILSPAEGAEAIVTVTDSGLDLLLATGAQLGLGRRERLAAFAEAQNLARVSRRHPKARGTEIIVERRPVRVRFGNASVLFPPGAFLQASAEGEAALRAGVLEALGPARRTLDLYAGIGTFAAALAAEGRQVQAYEADRDMVASLDAAIRASAGRWRASVVERDLDRRPLGPEELGRIEGAVLDPPRAGARAQAEMLAASEVERIAYVACNPASFARDARYLIDGGYALEWVQPVDQFLWSPHLELVAAFRRK